MISKAKFLGFENGGNYLGAHVDHSDASNGPGGQLGSATGTNAAFTHTINGATFGDSGAPTVDDVSWNRFRASFTYDSGSDAFAVETDLYNFGTLGASSPTLIASRSFNLSATGFSGVNLNPALGFFNDHNNKEAADRFSIDFRPVPETSSALLGGLVGGLLLMRRRR